MDVPLALNDIGIRYGLKGYNRKSSTFSLQTDVVGLSALIIVFEKHLMVTFDDFYHKQIKQNKYYAHFINS